MKLIFIVVIIVFIIVGKLVHYLIHSDSAIIGKLEGRKVMDILDIKNETDVVVEGKIINIEKEIFTPIAQKKCVWFKLEVYHWDRGWSLIADEINMTDFEIEDNTSKAKVVAGYMEVAVDDYKYESEKISENQMEQVLKFLEQKKALKNPLKNPILAPDSRLKFREKWLPLDSKIIIGAKCYLENDKKIIRSNKIKSMYIAVVD